MKEGDYKKWLYDQSKELLERMGYDTNRSIHDQFLEKHHEALNAPSPPPQPRVYKNKYYDPVYSKQWREKRKLLSK